MGAKFDEAKGRVKEAAGSLTGDKDLEAEGKIDRKAGEAKDKLDHAKDKFHDLIDKAEDKGEEAVEKIKDVARRK